MAEYFDPIQKYADQKCIATLQGAIRAIDALLDLPHPVPTLLKGLFGVAELENDDFGNLLQSPLGSLGGGPADGRVLAGTELGPGGQQHRLGGVLRRAHERWEGRTHWPP